MEEFESFTEAGQILSDNAICFRIDNNRTDVYKGFVDDIKGFVYLENPHDKIPQKTGKILVCCEGVVTVITTLGSASYAKGYIQYANPQPPIGRVTFDKKPNICGIAMSNRKQIESQPTIAMLLNFVNFIPV